VKNKYKRKTLQQVGGAPDDWRRNRLKHVEN